MWIKILIITLTLALFVVLQLQFIRQKLGKTQEETDLRGDCGTFVVLLIGMLAFDQV